MASWLERHREVIVKGAVAGATLLVAVVTGVLLYFAFGRSPEVPAGTFVISTTPQGAPREVERIVLRNEYGLRYLEHTPAGDLRRDMEEMIAAERHPDAMIVTLDEELRQNGPDWFLETDYDTAGLLPAPDWFVPYYWRWYGLFFDPRAWEQGRDGGTATNIPAVATLSDLLDYKVGVETRFGTDLVMWLDYLILRTQGAEYLAALRSGEVSFSNERTVPAITILQELAISGALGERTRGRSRSEVLFALEAGEVDLVLASIGERRDFPRNLQERIRGIAIPPELGERFSVETAPALSELGFMTGWVFLQDPLREITFLADEIVSPEFQEQVAVEMELSPVRAGIDPTAREPRIPRLDRLSPVPVPQELYSLEYLLPPAFLVLDELDFRRYRGALLDWFLNDDLAVNALQTMLDDALREARGPG